MEFTPRNLQARENSPVLFIGFGESGIQCVNLIEQQLPIFDEHRYTFVRIKLGSSDSCIENSNQESGIILIDNPPLKMEDHGQNDILFSSSGSSGNGGNQRLIARLRYLGAFRTGEDRRLDEQFRKVKECPGHISVFIIGSLNDAEAAFLGDLIGDVYSILERHSIRLLLPCLFWGNSRHEGWSIATLRELDRLTLPKRQFPWGFQNHYLTRENPLQESGLFSQVLLVESGSPEFIKILSNQLVALSEKSTLNVFIENFANMPYPHRLPVIICRSVTNLFPTKTLRRACVIKFFLDQYLCSNPGRTLLEQWIDEFTSTFNQILESILRQNYDDSQNQRNLHERIFRDGLIFFVNQNVLSRSSSIRSVISFLSLLSERFNSRIFQRNTNDDRLANLAREGLPIFRNVIRQVKENIKFFKNSLKDELGESLQQYEHQLLELRNSPGITYLSFPDTNIINLAYHWLKDTRKIPFDSKDTGWEVTFDFITGRVKPAFKIVGETIRQGENYESVLLRHWFIYTEPLEKQYGVTDRIPKISFEQFRENRAPSRRDTIFGQYFNNNDIRVQRLLVGNQNPWKGLPQDVRFCETDNPSYLTLLEFDFNVPSEGIPYQNDELIVYNRSRFPLHAFHQEIFSRKKELQSGEEKWFHPVFVRLMHNDYSFEISMWCVFFNWIISENSMGHKNWFLQVDDMQIALSSREFPAQTIEDALENFLINFPFRDFGGHHPLSSSNWRSTLKELEKVILKYRNKKKTERNQYLNQLKTNIALWKENEDTFLQQLSKYQKILLTKEESRRGNVSTIFD